MKTHVGKPKTICRTQLAAVRVDVTQNSRDLALDAKVTRVLGTEPVIEAINEKRGAYAPPTHDELVAYVEWLKRSG